VERRELAAGSRFSTGLCLSLVIVALALQSAVVVSVLRGIAAVASFAARHSLDHRWKHGCAILIGAMGSTISATKRS
jgi:hypothetical protein